MINEAMTTALKCCTPTMKQFIEKCISNGEHWGAYKIRFAAKKGIDAARVRFDNPERYKNKR